MLRTLRIASILTAAAAVCVVVLVAVFGLKGNPEIEAYLDQQGVIEEYKAKSVEVKPQDDAVSPLVTQAKAFALRIDPPPPPPPPKPVRPTPTPTPTQVAQNRPPVPPVQPREVSAKFTVMGTAMYPEHPEKSLVLVKDVRNNYTWYRQGETIGRQVVHEIRDGSVVLYQNGQMSEELFVPEPKVAKSLLKEEPSASPAGRDSVTAVNTNSIMPSERPMGSQPTRPIPNRTVNNTGRSVSSSAERYRRVSELSSSRQMRTPPPVQSPEEQVESLNESIASIQEIMAHEAAGATPEEQAQNEAMFKGLLEILESEKQNLNTDEAPDDAEATASEQ